MNELLLETSIKKLNSPKNYEKFISQFLSIKSNKIKLGRMYSYDYDFYKSYPDEIIKYFDKKPLVILISKWQAKGLWLGVNLHFLPVLLRANFINKIKNRNTQQFSKIGYNTVKISYSVIKEILYKAKNCVRWYRPEAMTNIYEIPNREWGNASQYQISSFYMVDINQIVDRYKGWENKPKSKPSPLKEAFHLSQIDQNFDYESFQTSEPSIMKILNENLINIYPKF